MEVDARGVPIPTEEGEKRGYEDYPGKPCKLCTGMSLVPRKETFHKADILNPVFDAGGDRIYLCTCGNTWPCNSAFLTSPEWCAEFNTCSATCDWGRIFGHDS